MSASWSRGGAALGSTEQVADAILATVRRFWGFEGLRPLQAEAIGAGLTRRDSLVVMPTGGGKSLCYQVPPAVAKRTDVVVSPLIALMKDQVDALRACGYPAAALHSGMDWAEIRDAEREIAAGPSSSDLRRARADAHAAVSGACRAPGRLQLRDRRGALHQPLGARLPPRIPPVGGAQDALSQRQPSRLHRDRHRARAPRHRGAASARRPRGAGRLLRSPQSSLPGHPEAGCQCAGSRRAPAPSRRGGDRLLHHPQRHRADGAVSRGQRHPRRPLSRRDGARRNAAAPRIGSPPKRSTWSWPRSLSAWESTAATSAA